MDRENIKRVRRHLKIRATLRKMRMTVLVAVLVFMVISEIFMPYASIESKRNTIAIGAFIFCALSLCVSFLARCPVCKKWIDTNSYYTNRGVRFRGAHPGTGELPNICPYCGTNFGKYDEDGWA